MNAPHRQRVPEPTRRGFIATATAAALITGAAGVPVDLLTAPIAVRGEWHAPPNSALAVVTRMRDVSLSDITLRSEHQPDAIWVQNNPSGPPAIWLHESPAKTAWIMVDVAPLAWCQLAYQFGHELGHALANSWERNAAAPPPCRWIEESLVEAFSVRGLALLADNWETNPPFPGDNAYASAIRDYRRDILVRYRKYAREQGATDLLKWFDKDREQLSHEGGLGPLEEAAVPVILGLIEPEPVLIEDYQALNRWPERSAIPLPEYLQKWCISCQQIGAPGRLPVVLSELLGAKTGI